MNILLCLLHDEAELTAFRIRRPIQSHSPHLTHNPNQCPWD